MAVFFDVSDINDRNLIHASVRDSEEIEVVVDKVEYEVIEYYKQRPSIPLRFRSGWENLYTTNDISVRLIGYDQNTPVNSDDNLKESLKHVIAEISSWVLRNYENGNKVSSMQQGDRSITYNGGAPTWKDFPPGWQRLLKNFDDREAVYSI